MEILNNLRCKLDKLISFLKEYKIVVAFSGGVDSSLLAFLANKYSQGMLAITIESILNPCDEINDTKKFVDQFKIPHQIIIEEPLKNENFVQNPKERCYICKKDIFNSILKIKDEKGFDIIIDGTNVDDLGDYRPGLQALKELNVISPYVKFNINKQEIRDISNYFNLPTYSKPSTACLASRIPFNEVITEKKLLMIKEAEKYLRETYNLTQLRVRLHKGNLARIELIPQDLLDIIIKKNIYNINQKFKKLGFRYVTVDLQGYRSGSLNEIVESERD